MKILNKKILILAIVLLMFIFEIRCSQSPIDIEPILDLEDEASMVPW